MLFNRQSAIGNRQCQYNLNTRLRPRLRRNSLPRQYPARQDRVQLPPGQFHTLHKTLFRPCPCPNQREHQRHTPGKFRSALFLPPPAIVGEGRVLRRSRKSTSTFVSNQANLPASDGICNNLFGPRLWHATLILTVPIQALTRVNRSPCCYQSVTHDKRQPQ